MIWYQTQNSGNTNNNDIVIYTDFQHVPHFHRDFELICVEKGEIDITVEDQVYRAREGQMALVLSNLIHAFTSHAPNRIIIHVFSQDNVPAFAKQVADRTVRTPVFDCDPDVRDFYVRYCIEKGNRSRFALKGALYAICGEFIDKCEFLAPGAPRSGGNTQLLHQMLSYISEHYQEEISLEKMAQDLGYEMHYLSRVFSTNIKMNIRGYINLYRVDSARERLIGSQDSIAQIAMESGFQSIRSFNRVFSANTGMTPMDYRKNFQKEKS